MYGLTWTSPVSTMNLIDRKTQIVRNIRIFLINDINLLDPIYYNYKLMKRMKRIKLFTGSSGIVRGVTSFDTSTAGDNGGSHSISDQHYVIII